MGSCSLFLKSSLNMVRLPRSPGPHTWQCLATSYYNIWPNYRTGANIRRSLTTQHLRLAKDEVLTVPNQLSITSRRHMGEWEYSSTFLDLVTRRSWGASFTSLLFYSLCNSPQYPLYRRLCGPLSRSGRCGESCIVSNRSECWCQHEVNWKNVFQEKAVTDTQHKAHKPTPKAMMFGSASWALRKERSLGKNWGTVNEIPQFIG
jgi:hypothetical protein